MIGFYIACAVLVGMAAITMFLPDDKSEDDKKAKKTDL